MQSGHFRPKSPQGGEAIINGKPIGGDRTEVFYPYQVWIRADGSYERLLNDDEVGWHSGNWAINCRSIAIYFDGDFRNTGTKPTVAAMKTCAKLIADYRRKFKIEQIIGHYEIKNTKCPGPWFQDGGKEELIHLADKVTKSNIP